MDKQIYDIKAISSYLDISISEVRKLVRERRIPFFRLGNRIKFDLEKINLWIEEKQENELKAMLFYFSIVHLNFPTQFLV